MLRGARKREVLVDSMLDGLIASVGHAEACAEIAVKCVSRRPVYGDYQTPGS